MGMTNFRASLRKRYSALTGERDDLHLRFERVKQDIVRLDEMEARVPELEKLIEAAAMLLKDNDPEWDAEETPALKPWTHHIPVPFGQCGRRGLNALREANRPMTVRQIAVHVLDDCNTPDPDKDTLRRVQNAIESSFRKFDGRSVESSGRYPKQWRAINKAEIEFDP